MKFPYWRHVQGTDDGCGVYQCLWCMAQWEARTSPNSGKWLFCPVCGFEWEREHECVEHGYRVYDMCRKHNVKDRHCVHPRWIIQSRVVDVQNNEPLPGQNWHKDSYNMDSLFEAHRHAKEREAEENNNDAFGLRVEFRIARWYQSAKSYGCGDAVLPGEPINPALQKFIKEHTEDKSWGRCYVAIELSREVEIRKDRWNVKQSVS